MKIKICYKIIKKIAFKEISNVVILCFQLVIKATTIQHQIKRKQNNLLDDNLVEVKTEKLRGNFSAQNNNIREAVNKSRQNYCYHKNSCH